jgi:hypothetical protein
LIFYLATAPHLYTINWFLEEWAPDLQPRVRVCSYDHAFRDGLDAAGTYVFADIERLAPDQLREADRLWVRLSRLGGGVRLLNRPLGTWRRPELLRRLHDLGINSFRARRFPSPRTRRMLGGPFGAALARAGDVRGGRRLTSPLLRFPVFLRSATEHDGALTPLLWGWKELRHASRELVQSGRDAGGLLIVEFCDTSDDDGLFRKYGAFVIGEHVVPRGIMTSRQWMVKDPDLETPALVQEQREYFETNPHAGWIRDFARRAGLGYGRVDYALKNGAPQIWEINTNPTVVMRRHTFATSDQALMGSLMRAIGQALESVDR